jgi:hypothetical protein
LRLPTAIDGFHPGALLATGQHHLHGGPVPWKFFIGASFLVMALLLPHAPFKDVAAGVAVAGGIQWVVHERVARK